MEKDRSEDARASLRQLHYDGHNDDFLVAEFLEIQTAINMDRQRATQRWSAILREPSWRRRLAPGCGIQAFGQLSGINGKPF